MYFVLDHEPVQRIFRIAAKTFKEYFCRITFKGLSRLALKRYFK